MRKIKRRVAKPGLYMLLNGLRQYLQVINEDDSIEASQQRNDDRYHKLESDLDSLKIKQKIRQAKFEKAWRKNTPDISQTEHIKKFDSNSGALVPELLDIVMTVLASSNAASTVNDALKEKFNAHQTSIAVHEINNMTAKLARIQTAKLLMEKSFNFDAETSKSILDLIIQKEFSRAPLAPNQQPSQMNMQEMLRMLGAPSPRQNKQRESIFTRKKKSDEQNS